MWMLIPLMLLMMCLSDLTVRMQQQSEHERSAAEAAVTGDRMRIYLDVVQHYVQTHPDFSGSVDESELALPVWFLSSGNLRHMRVSGQLYIYCIAPPSGLIGYLSRSMQDAVRIGINRNGKLVSPQRPAPVETCPPQLPEGSVVIAP